MSQHDDDDLDDEDLRPLRAVWLAMPDEEPPSRGLDALLAAARVKADEMAASSVASGASAVSAPSASAHPSVPAETDSPSWWQRLLALFQRPQILALATILILIGGAVFISHRRDTLQAPSPEVAAPEPSSHALPEVALEAPTAGAGSASSDPPASAAAAAERPGVVDDGTRADERERDAAKPADTKPAAREPRTVDAPHGNRETAATGLVAKKSTAFKTATTTQRKPKQAGGGAALDGDQLEDDLSAKGGLAIASPVEEEAPATPPTTRGPASSDEPSAKQLHERARAAAARSDCATVRALAKQIARLDAPYYRANIAPDKTLASCLN